MVFGNGASYERGLKGYGFRGIQMDLVFRVLDGASWRLERF